MNWISSAGRYFGAWVLLDQAVDQAEGVHTGRRAITAEQMNFPGKLRAISWMGSGWWPSMVLIARSTPAASI